MKILLKALCILLTLSVCLSLFSCSEPEDYAVSLAAEKMNVSYQEKNSAEYRSFNSSLSEFSSALSAEIYAKYGNGNENLCLSPISVYMALALTVGCSEGETREEILTALGMSCEEVSTYTKMLYSLCNEEYCYKNYFGNRKTAASSELHNSLWLDDSVGINTEHAALLSRNYNADIFSASFRNGDAEDMIEKYIEEKTHDLVDGEIEMNENTVFALINTFYLKEIWNEMGDELDKTNEKYTFKNSNGSEVNTYLLKSEYCLGRSYEGENYKTFFALTDHGYSLHLILPNEGVSAGSVFTEENLNEILNISDYGHVDDENRQLHYTRLFFPEFEAEFDREITSVLKDSFGIRRAFSPENAELSLISNDDLYCSKVIHKTSLTVDARGIEGAAVTVVLGDGAAAGPPSYERVNHELIVDRAFGFILEDPSGTVLFSGVVNEID